MKSKEIKQHIEAGFLHTDVIFEIIGQPKEHVKNTMKAYIENIKQEPGIIIDEEEYEPVDEVEKGIFSTVAEVKMLIESFEKLTWLCINFSPASIEILAPDNKEISQKELTHWLNDFLSKMHEIGVVQKTVQSQNQGLIRNFNAMTRNAIILALGEPKTLEEISKKIGMGKEHAEKFLEALIKENKVNKEKNKYFLTE